MSCTCTNDACNNTNRITSVQKNAGLQFGTENKKTENKDEISAPQTQHLHVQQQQQQHVQQHVQQPALEISTQCTKSVHGTLDAFEIVESQPPMMIKKSNDGGSSCVNIGDHND